MFKNILIPISSEFYSKEVLERGLHLAEKFNASIDLLYIIEEKTLNQAYRLSNTYRTHYDRRETKKEIIREQTLAADKIIFNEAEIFLKNKKISFEAKTVYGEFSETIKKEIDKKNYNLVLMGFEKRCTLNYRLFGEANIPIWIEMGKGNKTILAVCTNLAPNKKVPKISIDLAKILGWKLHMIYVVDIEDAVEVDEMGRRSNKKSEEDLIKRGKSFIAEMEKKGVDVELIRGSLEKETLKAAKKIKANLVIVGREQKKRGMFGIPTKNIKRKIVEKCKYSMLFVN